MGGKTRRGYEAIGETRRTPVLRACHWSPARPYDYLLVLVRRDVGHNLREKSQG